MMLFGGSRSNPHGFLWMVTRSCAQGYKLLLEVFSGQRSRSIVIGKIQERRQKLLLRLLPRIPLRPQYHHKPLLGPLFCPPSFQLFFNFFVFSVALEDDPRSTPGY